MPIWKGNSFNVVVVVVVVVGVVGVVGVVVVVVVDVVVVVVVVVVFCCCFHLAREYTPTKIDLAPERDGREMMNSLLGMVPGTNIDGW